MMRAREIALALGGDGKKRSGGRYWCCCPVHGDATPSMTIKDDDRWGDGIDVCCWSVRCDGGEIKAELRRRGLVSGRSRERKQVDPRIAERQAANDRAEQNRKRDWARVLWSRAEPNAAEVARYLTECRGIDLGRINGAPDCLRYQIDAVIPETDPKRYGMAMVAAVADALGEVTAIHETFLNFSGTAKAGMDRDKFVIGVMGGGAVRLMPAGALLGISEGIETGLSAAELTGIPTWATISTSGMVNFMVPPSVRRVVIFADFDPFNEKIGGRPGSIAAETLAGRLRQQCIEWEIRYPPGGTNDWNDALLARKRAGRAA